MTPQTSYSPVRQKPASSEGITHSIGIAGMMVVHAPDKIRTVLGSCIGIALYDKRAKIGGMAHVILPASGEGSGDPCKFADTAVNLLLDDLLAGGAKKSRINAKIVGGACMFGDRQTGRLGERNAEAVQQRLAHHSIPILASELGGQRGRKMMLDPATGEVEVAIIGEKRRMI